MFPVVSAFYLLLNPNQIPISLKIRATPGFHFIISAAKDELLKFLVCQR
jgi:hypothetical protein